MTSKPAADPFLQKILDEAAAMPLKDAAFRLWRWKYNFDREESSLPRIDSKDPAILARLANADFTTIYRFERAYAHDGITFDRLKRIHPNAADDDIKAAIKAAVKLTEDCQQFFVRDDTDFSAATDSAMARAIRENPGFQPDTYRAAENYLQYTMK